MVEGAQHARIDNMKKAKEIWELKLAGTSIDFIARKLSTSQNVINTIIETTDSSYYTTLMTKVSYYDEKLLIINKLFLDKKKLKKISDSLAYKKKIFNIILQATGIIIVALIVI